MSVTVSRCTSTLVALGHTMGSHSNSGLDYRRGPAPVRTLFDELPALLGRTSSSPDHRRVLKSLDEVVLTLERDLPRHGALGRDLGVDRKKRSRDKAHRLIHRDTLSLSEKRKDEQSCERDWAYYSWIPLYVPLWSWQRRSVVGHCCQWT